MKQLKMFVTLATILALASPAFAEMKLNGYYRMTGVYQDIKSKSNDPEAESLVDQRIRMKLSDKLNENVTFVYYGEVDTVWGEQSKGKVGGGGQLGTDGVNIETKNAYVDLKVPESDWALRVGLQGINDNLSGMVIDEDAAGVVVKGKLAGNNVGLIYSKFDEKVRTENDDTDFYGAQINRNFGEQFNLGGEAYLFDDNLTKKKIYYYGATADYKLKDYDINGFLVMQNGSTDTTNVDSQAFAASIKGSMTLPKGNLGLRFIYVSPDDSATDDNAWQSSIGEWEFAGENLMIFLPDKLINNSGYPRYAMVDGAMAGFGMTGLVASANLNDLPLGLYSKLGLGAFMAADDRRNGSKASHVAGDLVTASSDTRAGSMMGYEIAARVGKVIAEKFDISLRGAYASYGDFYDDTVDANGTVTNPDNVYKIAMMVNVNF
ncbi:porin [Geopsychrobacter electrodiphilus]|uniref:porin n=1 Tax=Geopsychrobacter electrodiphilus TaxID=225196 RepID=UPI000372BBF1|nr:porin [Geopsychrobacter electrodiphilus]